jgi:hypothetical protein
VEGKISFCGCFLCLIQKNTEKRRRGGKKMFNHAFYSIQHHIQCKNKLHFLCSQIALVMKRKIIVAAADVIVILAVEEETQ